MNELQILTTTKDIGESILTIQSIIDLIKPHVLEDVGAKLLYTGDLKYIQLLLGLKTGYACYPCPWCYWRMTGPLRDPVETLCAEREMEKDIQVFIKLGKDRSKSKKCHGQQNIPPIIINPKQQLVPPVLHIKLGLVNAKCLSLEKKIWRRICKP